jgi:two-component system chemotaxis sensor kinase CheA
MGGEGGRPVSFDPATRARLVGLFVAESEETLAQLGEISGRLRRRAVPEDVSDFGRIAHGLKGAAAALGYEDLARALHDLEDLVLGLPGADSVEASARHRRLRSALELLAEGVARMSATGQEAFPADLLPTLLATVARGTGADAEPAGPPGEAAGDSDERGREPETAAAERLSVPAGEVDAALRLASSLARNAAQLQEAIARDAGAFSPAAQSLAQSAQAIEAIIASLRLLPADVALSGLADETAELAVRLGKRVVLCVDGREVRADRRTLQAARGMIRHLVRNAIDHGIEAPAERLAAGKPEAGRLSVHVEAGESALRVAVEDDGAGFDVAAIRRELSRRDGDRAASLSDEEILQAWAAEGGSTRASATEISGRGLGLSAVATMARAAGGGLHVRSARGAGSAVAFTLPLEVYATEVLSVTAAGRAFAIPLHAVERTVHLAAAGAAVHEGPAGRTLAVDETILPLVRLADAVGGAPGGEDRFAVVVLADSAATALAVDDLGAAMGVVPSTVPGVAQADALVTGLARLADGAPVSILNPRLLLARARSVRVSPRAAVPEEGRATRRDARPPALPSGPARPGAAPLEVVLAEDSLATREVLRVLLEEQGFRVRLAGDGEEALIRVGERVPDVIVSDVNMPRRDGLSLARELRRRADTARLPIVLLTSRDDEATRSAGAEAGADAYLLKSRFNASVLLDTLARIGVRAAR